ncbi:hypothetical protein [Dysgonomonas sp. 37-18]|uniref:hypothetical protein n=1 Tax=Dysgonomonas sp. 37-18 TaxID=1895907 RepID=UPI00092AABD3|nr:hypothetical protein [Dysgonomonas sp. 37-18]OJX63072.1 MAG: hypothetical protein BGO84_14305 [Dysgonomonas sp. 37-18]
MSKDGIVMMVLLFIVMVISAIVVTIQDETIEVYEKHNEMQQRAIDNCRENKIFSDSIINILEKIKVTKITIIEKDTVSNE